MKIFHCAHCGQVVFFENTRCVKCEHTLAYDPELAEMCSLEPVADKQWPARAGSNKKRTCRLCANYEGANICNWIVADDTSTLCLSCRLTKIIPDLSQPGHHSAWFRIESAKRRLIYGLLALNLPLTGKIQDPAHGLEFDFLADMPGSGEKVMTGHMNGTIRMNIAEADDSEREKRRLQLHEPYRTLLGHFRHEIGHYYWDRLVKDSDRLAAFRETFGDERENYGPALNRYYRQGAPDDWQKHFVSAYASAHAWEDWAESWAHYLHLTDTLETAAGCGLFLRPWRSDEPALTRNLRPGAVRSESFDEMIARWFPLTYVLNNLNRDLGMPDAYPFVLSDAAVQKLHVVHDTILLVSQESETAERSETQEANYAAP